MDKLNFYNQQHVAADDMRQIYLDTEEALAEYISDFYTSKDQIVITNTLFGSGSLLVHQTGSASLDVEINAGVGYLAFQRIELPTLQTLTLTDIPRDSGGGLIVTRIDLVYLERIEQNSQPFAIDFIDENRNIYQETKYTRLLDSYEIKILTGVYNIGGASKPVALSGTLPLAYIHLRDATSKVYDADTSGLNDGYVEDFRDTFTYNDIVEAQIDASFEGSLTDFISRQGVINGNFDVWNRGTSFTSIATATHYPDRWKTNINDGAGTAPTATIERSTDVPLNGKSKYSCKIDVTAVGTASATTDWKLLQLSEDYEKFKGQSISVSFQAKAPANFEYFEVFVWDGVSTQHERFRVKTYYDNYTFENVSISSAATELSIYFCIANGIGMSLASDSSYAPSTIGAYYLSQVQLNVGATAYEYFPKTSEEEYILCGNPSDVSADTYGINTEMRPSILTYPSNSIYRQGTINGNFDIWQRGITFTNPATSVYTADRWQVQKSSGGGTAPSVDVIQSSTTPNSSSLYSCNLNASNIGVSSATTSWKYTQALQDHEKLQGKTISLSFWIKSPATSTVGIQIWDGVSSNVKEISCTTSWTKYKFENIAIDSSATMVQLSIALAGGTHADAGGYSTNFIPALIGDYYLSQVQVNEGITVLPFLPKSEFQELQDCFKYYYKWSSDSSYSMGALLGVRESDDILRISTQLPVLMNKAPSVAISGTGVDAVLYDGTNVGSILASTILTTATKASSNVELRIQQTGIFTNNGIHTISINDGVIALNAE